MGDIVNLRTRRKRKALDEGQKEAGANRMRFGRPKAVRDAEKANAERAARELDNHLLGRPKGDRD